MSGPDIGALDQTRRQGEEKKSAEFRRALVLLIEAEQFAIQLRELFGALRSTDPVVCHLVVYVPITIGSKRCGAWQIYEPNGTLSLSYVMRDGRLFCNDRVDVVGGERRPHYTSWKDHIMKPSNHRTGVVRQLRVARDQLRQAVCELQAAQEEVADR